MSGYNPSELPPKGMGGVGRPAQAEGERPPAEEPEHAGLPKIDVVERGADRAGQAQAMDRRLFMQLLVFECGREADPGVVGRALAAAMESARVPSVVYEDVNDPRGLALLTWSEDPERFVTAVRPALGRPELASLVLRPAMTMLGRTYSNGYEQDLEYWLLRRPQETALEEKWPWALWYPLRRSGDFERLEPREQGKILKEHAIIGRAYGAKDLAHDIRLACHGLDANDNEFVIGLIGKSLHPLSHVVQTMRKTKQTSTYIVQMGPFFVGRVAHRVAAG